MHNYLRTIPKTSTVTLVTGMWDYDVRDDQDASVIGGSVQHLNFEDALVQANHSNWGEGTFGHPDVWGFFVLDNTPLDFFMNDKDHMIVGFIEQPYQGEKLPSQIKQLIAMEDNILPVDSDIEEHCQTGGCPECSQEQADMQQAAWDEEDLAGCF